MDFGEKLSLLSARNRQAVHVFQEEYKWYQFPYYSEDPDNGYWFEYHYEGITYHYSTSDGDEGTYLCIDCFLGDMLLAVNEAAEDAIEEIWEEKGPVYEEIAKDWLKSAEE